MLDHPTHEKLTIQTTAAFERLYDALTGKTEDDFKSVTHKIHSLIEKVEQIDAVSNELNH